MAARTASTKAKSEPVDEPDEDEFEEMEDADDDLDDLEEVEEVEEDEAPAKKPTKKASTTKKADTEIKGSAWLAAYVTEQTGDKYDARSIRMLLRKLARDGKHERVVGETRERYNFTGPNDQTVKAVLAMVRSGEAKAMKQEGLAAVKEKAAAKRAAAKANKEAQAEPVEDDEEVEEAPTPTRRRTAAKSAPAKATPAKATAARRRASTTA